MLNNIERVKDRIGRYLKKYLKDFLFSELSIEYLAKTGMAGILSGIPVPFQREDTNGNLSIAKIGQNMLFVIGCDPKFRYVREYIESIRMVATENTAKLLLEQGRKFAKDGKFDFACIYFRAVCFIFEKNPDAMFEYALVCRAMYLAEDSEEYIGRFKAEALDYLELTTMAAPERSEPYFYLGYGYLNMGLYKKAELAWNEFMKLSGSDASHECISGMTESDMCKMRCEINERLKELVQPIKIEEGCNLIASGRYDEGLNILEHFIDSDFKGWWPMHYYIGIAYEMTGRLDRAVCSFKSALCLNAGHIESMQELVKIYERMGDKENYIKYMQKIDIVSKGIHEDNERRLAEAREKDNLIQ